MGDTNIEWTRNADGTAGKTWNPIRARSGATGKVGWFCEHVSEGCRNCYAEKMNRNTYFGNGLDYKPAVLDQVEIFLDEKILQQPLHWRKPTAIFPCSMTDMFGRWVKDEWLDRIFAVMALAKQHTFQCLTKRPDRMLDYFSDPYHMNRTRGHALSLDNMRVIREAAATWPLSNAWLGVSVEDQKTADERIPLLLQTPAAVRWISAEPLLGPVSLECVNFGDRIHSDVHDVLLPQHGPRYLGDGSALPPLPSNSIDWVVVGGESGPRARPFDLKWGRNIVQQCEAAGVPVFVKQLGAKPIDSEGGIIYCAEGCNAVRLKDKKGGDINEWPEDLRVREYPKTEAVVA